MASSKFSPDRLAAAQCYLRAFVERHRDPANTKDHGFTAAAAALDVSQPTITNALGPMGSFGPKLLEALARVDNVSFDEILGWEPVDVLGAEPEETAANNRDKLEAAREKRRAAKTKTLTKA